MPKVKQEAYINKFMIAKIEEHKDEDLKIDYNQLSPLFYEFWMRDQIVKIFHLL